MTARALAAMLASLAGACQDAPSAATPIRTTSGQPEAVIGRGEADCVGRAAAENFSKRGLDVTWRTPQVLEAEGPFRGRRVRVIYEFAPLGEQVRVTATVLAVEADGAGVPQAKPVPPSQKTQAQFMSTIASLQRWCGGAPAEEGRV